MRGRLVETNTTDTKVWVVASVDGTDPQAMPEDGSKALVVAVWNDHRDEREITVNLQAPTGTEFGKGVVEMPRQNPETLGVVFNKEDLAPTSPTATSVTLKLPDVPLKVSLPLTAHQPKPQKSSVINISFRIFGMTSHQENQLRLITVDAARIALAKKATLRVILEHAAEGEAIAAIAGTAITLPKAVCRDNGNLLVEVPVDLALVKETTDITFTVADGHYAGYQVDTALIILE